MVDRPGGQSAEIGAGKKAALAADIKEIYSEAKVNGVDTKVIRMIVRLRKMDQSDRQEQEQILDLYKRALDID